MEWFWHDPNRDELTKWWTINPQTGEPDGEKDSQKITQHCLGESALYEVAMAADNIATTFTTKCFTDEEVSALIMGRVVPASFKGGVEDAAELLDCVEDLWVLTERCYQQALGRNPTNVERRWLYSFAFSVLRARQNGA